MRFVDVKYFNAIVRAIKSENSKGAKFLSWLSKSGLLLHCFRFDWDLLNDSFVIELRESMGDYPSATIVVYPFALDVTCYTRSYGKNEMYCDFGDPDYRKKLQKAKRWMKSIFEKGKT